jgi:uncharacterized BrkB/YihY/UPF0761 family membrane protein
VALMVFSLIYKYMPNTRTYWSSILPGAILAAFLFEVGKYAFIIYLNNFANYQNIYGSLASVIILLVWIYYLALILVIEAEFSSEYTRMRRGVSEGELLTGLHQDEEKESEDRGMEGRNRRAPGDGYERKVRD